MSPTDLDGEAPHVLYELELTRFFSFELIDVHHTLRVIAEDPLKPNSRHGVKPFAAPGLRCGDLTVRTSLGDDAKSRIGSGPTRLDELDHA
jgi:hypothetical protein